jgi:TonB family protein
MIICLSAPIQIDGEMMKIARFNIFTIAALAVSIALHAAVISGVLYVSGAFKNNAVKKAAVHVQPVYDHYKILPDVELIADASTLKKNTEEPSEQTVKKEDFGTKTAVQNGGIAEADVFMYQDAVRHRIEQARDYPDEARREGQQGSVGIDFTVLSDGGVESIAVTKSSGRELLDAEAVATIKRASPFPSFSGFIKNDKMNVQILMVYRLN